MPILQPAVGSSGRPKAPPGTLATARPVHRTCAERDRHPKSVLRIHFALTDRDRSAERAGQHWENA
jgi:hypothetical protein